MMLKLLSSIIIFLCAFQVLAQDAVTETELLKSIDFCDTKYENRNIVFNQIKGKSFIAKYNPFTLTANSMLFLYQQLFSVQISASCLYHTSCSEFSKHLIKDYGIVKGIPLSADRLSRCNRIASTDIHPLKIDEHSHKVIESTNIYKNRKEKK
jgi:uncharacterized protein